MESSRPLYNRKHTKTSNPPINYEDKLSAIGLYFGVSDKASKYLYHRRRRGFPYKRDGMPRYLKWSTQLQNSLVKADQLSTWSWEDLEFECDVSKLAYAGLDIDKESDSIYVNKLADQDGWSVVPTKSNYTKYVVRRAGLLPPAKNAYVRFKRTS